MPSFEEGWLRPQIDWSRYLSGRSRLCPDEHAELVFVIRRRTNRI